MDKQLLIAFNQKFQDFLATYAQLEKSACDKRCYPSQYSRSAYPC